MVGAQALRTLILAIRASPTIRQTLPRRNMGGVWHKTQTLCRPLPVGPAWPLVCCVIKVSPSLHPLKFPTSQRKRLAFLDDLLHSLIPKFRSVQFLQEKEHASLSPWGQGDCFHSAVVDLLPKTLISEPHTGRGLFTLGFAGRPDLGSLLAPGRGRLRGLRAHFYCGYTGLIK